MNKIAFELPKFLSGLGDQAGDVWNKNKGAIVGGGLGVAGGLAANALMPKRHNPRTGEDDGAVPSWLLPLLAGGAGAAGGHFLNDAPHDAATPAPAPAPAAVIPRPISPEQQGRNLAGMASFQIDRHPAVKALVDAAKARLMAKTGAATPVPAKKAPMPRSPLAPGVGAGGRLPTNTMSKVAFVAKHALAKTAFDNPLAGIDWSKLWDEHKGKIIGGVGGAALGGLAGAFTGDDENRGRNGTLGGLAGLAAGLGGGYLYDNPEAMEKLKAMVSGPPAPKPVSLTGGGVGATTGGLAGLGAGMGAKHLLTRPRANGDIPAGRGWAKALPLAGLAAGATGGGYAGL